MKANLRGLLVIAVLTGMLSLLGCGSEPKAQCSVASDCEGRGLIHPACEGNWICVDSMCDWECSLGEELDPNVELLDDQLLDISGLEEELDFSDLDNLEEELAEIDW
jgi:hypothetical protein